MSFNYARKVCLVTTVWFCQIQLLFFLYFWTKEERSFSLTSIVITVVLLCNFWTALCLSLSRLHISAFWAIIFINHSKLNYSRKPNTILLFIWIQQVYFSRSNSAAAESQIKFSHWAQTTNKLLIRLGCKNCK